MDEKYVEEEYGSDSRAVYNSGRPANYDNEDVFGHEEGHDVISHSLTLRTNSSRLLNVVLMWGFGPTDQIQDSVMAARGRLDDSRDRQ